MERSSSVVGIPTAVMAYELRNATNWWEHIDESPLWQDRIFHVLAALFGVVAVVALVFLYIMSISAFSFSFFLGFHIEALEFDFL